MARDGYKIFDADTHTGPVMEVLDKYLTDAERSKLPAWEQYKVKHASKDHYFDATTYTKGNRKYRRRLGENTAETQAAPKTTGYTPEFTGAKKKRAVTPSLQMDVDPKLRIEGMDVEGVDVNLMLPSGWFGTFTSGDDVALEMGMYRAYHRWTDEYCSAFPERLGGVLIISGRDIAGSLEEIRRWGKSRWAWGVLPWAPYGMPLDHTDLEPIWAAAQEYDMVVALHTVTAMPPYSPGGLDNWENMFLQRSAAHPWCGMRNMAALIGSGILDRYPKLRIGTLEAGHGWLPFWLARLDEHAETCKSSIQNLKRKPSEYVAEGRYFQSIEIHEGANITNSVSELLGDDVLMYGSDYPHGESHWPESVNSVMEWKMPDERRRKLMWDNSVKCYARCGLK